MNLLIMLVDSLVSFVRRNPIFCLVVLILAIGAPSLLAGIASVILYIILGFIILMLIMSMVFRWRIYKLRNDLEQAAGRPNGYRSQRREGDVSIHINDDAAEKRIKDDVGDYVDFVEEKNSDK